MKKFILVLILVFSIWVIWGNTRVSTRVIEVKSEKIPSSFNGYKIAHISDYHNKDWDEKILIPLRNSKPNIIAITGDLIDSRKTNTDVSIDFVKKALEIAPVYYVTGNHEGRYSGYNSFKADLEALGVEVLENESKEHFSTLSSESIQIIGVNDPNFTRKTSELNTNYKILESFIDPIKDLEKFTILLSHRPEQYKLYQDKQIELTLSGHAHGGQFRIPFIGAIYAPGQGFFPKYTSGLYELEKGAQLIVSRGLGNSMIPIRINNKADLIIIELKSSI